MTYCDKRVERFKLIKICDIIYECLQTIKYNLWQVIIISIYNVIEFNIIIVIIPLIERTKLYIYLMIFIYSSFSLCRTSPSRIFRCLELHVISLESTITLHSVLTQYTINRFSLPRVHKYFYYGEKRKLCSIFS